MTLKGITISLEERIKAIEVRQQRLLKFFEEVKPLLIKYEENANSEGK